MSRREIDQALSAANPIDRSEVGDLALEEGERELLAGIVAEPQDGDAGSHPTRLSGGSSRRRSIATRYLTIAAAGACGLVAFFVVDGGGGATGPPASAYAAELARIAKHSKVVVFDPATGSTKGGSVSAPGRQSSGGWTLYVPTVWDCTELPCVRRSVGEMKAAGIVPGGKTWRVSSEHVAVVIPPSDGE